MIDKEHALPVARQVKLLQALARLRVLRPVPISDADLELMREIDKLHLEHPFAGARMLRDFLKRREYRVGRRHVGRLMDLMGIEALYRKKRGTRRNPAHPVYPYLLRNLVIDRPNQVWCADINTATNRTYRLRIAQLPSLWIMFAPRETAAPARLAGSANQI